MSTVTSKDGTSIAYERAGSGPAVILVDGALCSRQFGPSPEFAKRLASQFTVISYDRRGRGASGDEKPYAKSREIEDLAALVEAAGGAASLVGLSSGAALALEAAAANVGVTKVAAYEPPYVADGKSTVEHEVALRRMIAEGRRGDAVKYFMRDMVSVPAPVVVMMRLMFWMWPKLEAVAHTLPYDAAVMSSFVVPAERFANIRVPTLVMHGGRTTAPIIRAANEVARAIPNARHRVLEGQRHDVKPDVLVPVVSEFFRSDS